MKKREVHGKAKKGKRKREGKTHTSINLPVDFNGERRRSRVVDTEIVRVGDMMRGGRIAIRRGSIAWSGGAVRRGSVAWNGGTVGRGRKGGRRSPKIDHDFLFNSHCLVRERVPGAGGS